MAKWSAPSCTMEAIDHYDLLGIASAGKADDASPVQRVLRVAAIGPEVIKECYNQTLNFLETSGNTNPFMRTKVQTAFSVLSNSEQRKLYDLDLMQKAAVEMVPRLCVQYFYSTLLYSKKDHTVVVM